MAGKAENSLYGAGQPLSVTLRSETRRIPADGGPETIRNPAARPANTGADRPPEHDIRRDAGVPLQPSANLLHHLTPADVDLIKTEETTNTSRNDTSLGIDQSLTVASLPDTPDTVAPPEMSLQGQLRAMMAASFSYPLLARQRNWQGEVRLGLRVEANGRLSHIHVVKSSGYTILDRAAERSLEQIAAVPDAVNWLRGRHFDTVIPVEYRLIDS